jgi:hypothetical protein
VAVEWQPIKAQVFAKKASTAVNKTADALSIMTITEANTITLTEGTR